MSSERRAAARRLLRAASVLSLGLAACGPELELGSRRAECEGLSASYCLFPWPSSRSLVSDPSRPAGLRLEIPRSALPRSGSRPTLDAWEGLDGAPASTSILTAYPGELAEDALAGEERIERSVDAGSPTLLVDIETGEQVPHWAEVDHRRGAAPGTLLLRPASLLEEGHRYAVGIRGLSRPDEVPVALSDAFRALRDGLSTDADDLEARREGFEEVFAALEGAGAHRAELLEAWDFRTASAEATRGELTRMREAALLALDARRAELGCTAEVVIDEPDAETWRHVRGHFTAPNFLDDGGARLARDADGRPRMTGLVELPFEAVVSASAHRAKASGGAPARAVLFGHGLFGSAARIRADAPRRILDRAGAVGVATDFVGLAEADLGAFAGAMSDYGAIRGVAERLTQGVIANLTLARSLRGGACAALPELAGAIDPEASVDYLGISQGAILGPTIAALSEDIERVALLMGAIDYSLLFPRSAEFAPFDGLLELSYADARDRQWLLASTAIPFARVDSASFARGLPGAPLGGGRTRRVLLQVARDDAAVANVASDRAARAMGLPVIRGSARTPFGLELRGGPLPSAYAVFAVPGVAPRPPGLVTVTDNDAHGSLPGLEQVQRQLVHFLRAGEVIEACVGAGC